MALHAKLAAALAIGLATAIALLLWQRAQRRPIGALQWVSLALLVISGGVALLAHDARIVALKPTVMYVVLGVLLLRRGWLIPYVPAAAARWIRPEDRPLLDRLGFHWAGLMFATAALNAVVAVHFPRGWPAFIGLFPFLSKAALFAAHYALLRARIRSRRKAAELEQMR